MLLGDLNMPIAESSKMRSLIRSQTWNNASSLASHEYINAPTCHPGNRKGSQIDFILTSASLYDQLFQYDVTKFVPFKDHSLFSVRCKEPAPIQTRCSLRAPSALPNLSLPQSIDTPIACMIDSCFHTAIVNTAVDVA